MSDTPKPATPLPLPLPIVQGNGGYNASNLYDEEGNAICQLYGLPLHTTVDELSELVVKGRFAEGARRADYIVHACNTLPQVERERDEAIANLAECVDLLTSAQTALRWFRDAHPEHDNECDGEFDGLVTKLLTRMKPRA